MLVKGAWHGLFVTGHAMAAKDKICDKGDYQKKSGDDPKPPKTNTEDRKKGPTTWDKRQPEITDWDKPPRPPKK
jgi:hypothetical protein